MIYISEVSFMFPISFQACFDFARIVATVIDVDIVPVEEIIKSISCILEQDDKEVSIFRYMICMKFFLLLLSYSFCN